MHADRRPLGHGQGERVEDAVHPDLGLLARRGEAGGDPDEDPVGPEPGARRGGEVELAADPGAPDPEARAAARPAGAAPSARGARGGTPRCACPRRAAPRRRRSPSARRGASSPSGRPSGRPPGGPAGRSVAEASRRRAPARDASKSTRSSFPRAGLRTACLPRSGGGLRAVAAREPGERAEDERGPEEQQPWRAGLLEGDLDAGRHDEHRPERDGVEPEGPRQRAGGVEQEEDREARELDALGCLLPVGPSPASRSRAQAMALPLLLHEFTGRRSGAVPSLADRRRPFADSGVRSRTFASLEGRGPGSAESAPRPAARTPSRRAPDRCSPSR